MAAVWPNRALQPTAYGGGWATTLGRIIDGVDFLNYYYYYYSSIV